jgi:hypothetical protein
MRPFVTPAILILFSGNMVMSNPVPNGPTHIEDFTPQAEKYIKDYHNMAIQEMKRSMVPASITLAQGMLESGYGSSELANYANNHFGIKCHKGWTGETYICKSGENTNGYLEAKKSCFRSYSTVGESFQDHSDFLSSRSNYSFLFQSRTLDYKVWAKGLLKAGYATDPHYAEKIISTIEAYNLSDFDQLFNPEILLDINFDEPDYFNDFNTLKDKITNLETYLHKSELYKDELKEQLSDKQKTLSELKLQHIELKKELDARIDLLYNSLNNQNKLIESIQGKLERTESIQKNILRSDPLIGYFNTDGTKKESTDIFPPQKLDSDRIFYQKGRKATITTKERNLFEISEAYGIDFKDLLKFNDLTEGNEIAEGYYIFLEPKANQVKNHEMHQMKKGETMHSISQLYSIKISKLYQRNHLTKDEEPKIGEFIFLNKSNSKRPQVLNKQTEFNNDSKFDGGGANHR